MTTQYDVTIDNGPVKSWKGTIKTFLMILLILLGFTTIIATGGGSSSSTGSSSSSTSGTISGSGN